MNLTDMAQFVGDRVGKSDTDSLALIKQFLRRRYQMIYDNALWRDSLTTLTVTTSNAILVMPYYVERVVAMRRDTDSVVAYQELQRSFQVDPAIFDRTGTTLVFSELTPISISSIPSTATTLTFTSDSVADIGISLRLFGEDINGVEQRETITLNGTTAVVSTTSWGVPLTCAKDTTTGNVTVKDSGANTLLTLWPEENERKYARIRLLEQPSASTSFLLLAKRKLKPLLTNQDTPIIRGIDNALMSFAEADMLKHMRQYNKAQLSVQEAGTLLQVVSNLEKQQSASFSQIVPEQNGEWDVNDWF